MFRAEGVEFPVSVKESISLDHVNPDRQYYAYTEGDKCFVCGKEISQCASPHPSFDTHLIRDEDHLRVRKMFEQLGSHAHTNPRLHQYAGPSAWINACPDHAANAHILNDLMRVSKRINMGMIQKSLEGIISDE